MHALLFFIADRMSRVLYRQLSFIKRSLRAPPPPIPPSLCIASLLSWHRQPLPKVIPAVRVLVLACSCHKVTTRRVISSSRSTKSTNQLRIVTGGGPGNSSKNVGKRGQFPATGSFMPSSRDNRTVFLKMISPRIAVCNGIGRP